ncbi:hypothetical protein K435DRAFT_663760, partial [Dendrothele bispora CBS 962.96]
TPLTPNSDPGLLWESGVSPQVPLGHPIGPIQVHPYLLPNTVQLDLPVLQWEITQHAKKARVLTENCLLERLNLDEPAVMGHNGYNNNQVRIGSDNPLLGWWMKNMWGPLIIENEGGEEVSVGDVLRGIYKYLAQPLTHLDYEKVAETEGDLGSLDMPGSAWKGGWATAGEAAMVSCDYRRCDVLGSMKKFVGLRPTLQRDGIWMLYLDLASGGMVKV